MPVSRNDPKKGMEDNLKRAVTEMLVLNLLAREDMHAPQIMKSLEEGSGGALTLVSPYMLFYRLIENGYMIESCKKIALDGRRRQYYQITEAGRHYLAELIAAYRHVTRGVESLLGKEEEDRES